MEKDIVPYIQNTHLETYEEFSREIDNITSSDKFIDKLSDKYSELPVSIKALANFDNTGIISYLSEILENNKANRESEAIKKALYILYVSMKELGNEVYNIRKDKADILYEEYLERAKKSGIDKIEYLKNGLLHGLFNSNSLEEDINMLNLIQNLTIVQINILIIFSEKQYTIEYSRLRAEADFMINIKNLNKKLNVEHSIIKRNCLDLIGKGLLEDWGIGRLDYKGPEKFIINDYTKMLIEYVQNIR